MEHPVIIRHLCHAYGRHPVYEDLSLSFEKGKVYALLGKNGVGKTTLIKIIMGFLRPLSGDCFVFGDPANELSPRTRSQVGLLFERHLAYEFFSIRQIERFYARFYPQWNANVFYEMVDRLKVPYSHKIAHLSEGQRSQVVLGLMLAQDAELLILDDYSMGLDAGYRRLFVDYLAEYFKSSQRTLIVTSHVIQDMERFVDEVIFLERGGQALQTSLERFSNDFRLYRLLRAGMGEDARQTMVSLPQTTAFVKNVEEHPDYWDVFSFSGLDDVRSELARLGLEEQDVRTLVPVAMNLEDAFVGYTGRY